MAVTAYDTAYQSKSKRASVHARLNGRYTDGLPTIGTGRPVLNSTLVKTAQSQAHVGESVSVEVPNMVEMQLESYQWFLNQGLRELFDSFSPIEDFTGTMSLEVLDYTLGEPKFAPDECRE
ncbi:MAG: DNA-directed polymerase subunit beta, partial [Abditibacteriota bacterium]|nr:DNA-directed polymerase subunit beta [Abditibacteriota bacterium]